jgi:murein DD-endopeptidase MepM/ murein hydrolase activator NlpD
MDEQFNIIIAGNRGKVLRLPCSKKRIRTAVMVSTAVIVVLAVAGISLVSFYSRHRNSPELIAKLRQQVKSIATTIADRNQLRQQIISLELEAKKQVMALQQQQELTATLRQQLESKTLIIAEQQKLQQEERRQLRQEIVTLQLEAKNRAKAFQEEKDYLIASAVSELNERSNLIEKMIKATGVKLPEQSMGDAKNSGGPFKAIPEGKKEQLLFKTEKYLNALRYLPFGRPLPGRITSDFGRRKDPLNKKTAFHEGVDLKGRRGEKIYATADGVVEKAYRNRSYGNSLKINHGNGYCTTFSHLQGFLVKKGDKVHRGQPIGKVGTTGRSTGPHLHYEVLLKGKPINPKKFMTIAKLPN